MADNEMAANYQVRRLGTMRSPWHWRRSSSTTFATNRSPVKVRRRERDLYVLDGLAVEADRRPPADRVLLPAQSGGRPHHVGVLPVASVGASPGGYWPVEFERFMRWIEFQHPEVHPPFTWPPEPDAPFGPSQLFYWAGQELVHILTRENLDL